MQFAEAEDGSSPLWLVKPSIPDIYSRSLRLVFEKNTTRNTFADVYVTLGVHQKINAQV